MGHSTHIGAADLVGAAWRPSARCLAMLASAYLVVAALGVVWVWQGWGGEFVAHLVGDSGSIAGPLIAGTCIAWAARSTRGRARRGWSALTAGVAAWGVGAVIWSYYETWQGTDRFPTPSIADVAFLLFPVGAVAAMWWLSSGRQSRIRLMLDGVIVAISVVVLAWVIVLERAFHPNGRSPLANGVSIAYLLVDAVVIAIAILVFAGAPVAHRRSLGLLAAGLCLMACTDIAVTYLARMGGDESDHFIDLARFVAFGLLALSALTGIQEDGNETSQPRIAPPIRLWLPYVPLVFAVTFLFGRAVPQIGLLLMVLAALLVVSVLVRQLVVLVENRNLLSEVAELAYRDQLTGLANRTLFLDLLGRAVARRRRTGGSLALLCLDLDNFKTVNDDLGHPAGDELLVRVAGRVSACLGSSEAAARLGGDEFAVLVHGSVERALTAADRILMAFDEPIVIDGVPLTVRPSIGLTIAADDPGSTSADDLLRQADLAMYAAKRSGGGCVRSFIPGLPNPYELPDQSVVDSEPTSDEAAGAVISSVTVPPRLRPPTAVRLAFLALIVALVGFTISTFIRHPGRIVPLDSWLYDTMMLSAAALVLVRAMRTQSERWAWLLIGAGMAISALGDVVYALWVPEGTSPSLADPFYLAMYPLGYAGLILLARNVLRKVPLAILLDGLVVGCTVAAVAAAVAFGLLGGPVSAATVSVGLAYAAGDLVMVAIAVGVLTLVGLGADRRWYLLVVGFVVWAVADTVYLFRTADGTYLEGSWLDACWPAAYLLIAVAGWTPSAPALSRVKPGLRSFVLPGMCAVIAVGVSMFAFGDRLPVALAMLALVAVAVRFAVTFRDVSALALHHRDEMTDGLTGLANRRALATALTAVSLDRTAEKSESGRSHCGLVLLDVDQFGEINESLGRAVGDELLCHIAQRLSQTVRPEDLLARTGADEFAVLLAGKLDLTTARAQAGRLIEALSVPFALDHITVRADVRVAVALCPDHAAQPEQLLRRVESTMEYASASVGRIAVYNAAVDLPASRGDRLVKELRAALENDQLTCHYQPKISADGEQVHSVEALVRWQHPTRGLLLPNEFLPAAEQAGLMRSVTTRVLDIALAQVRAWREESIELDVAVNLSATNLLDLDLVGTIRRLLQMHEVPARSLILEITESTLTTDSQRALNTVEALRHLGIRLSLDDYGTGWSSLARLQELSVDELKLDGVFINRLARDPRSIAIVRSTVALAHSLGADLVAEGVEDADTLRALRLYGCTITQGHVHSPPLPADSLARWLHERIRDPQFGVDARVG